MPTLSKAVIAEGQSEEPQENVKYSLIDADFSNTEAFEKHNIITNNISSFTPFNLEEGARVKGSSFKFSVSERNVINNQFVYVNQVSVPKQENSLFVWIYFDTVYVHDLTITLTFENNATLVWALSQENLVDLLNKTSSSAVLSLPFAWNKIELPFNLAVQTGEIYNQSELLKISKMSVNFYTEEAESEKDENLDVEEGLKITYSKLLFHDIYISKSNDKNKYNVEKQNYRFFKFNFWTDEFVNSLCVGDEIYLPTSYKTVVKYAWNGEDDLKNGGLNTISWQIVVKTPDGEENLYPSFGDKLTFDQEGVYQVYYQCKDTRYSNKQPIISDSIKFTVRKLKPVYFDKSTFSMKTNKTYMINVYTSSAFSNITNLTFTSQNENLQVEYKGNGVLAVTPKKTGNYKINITISGVRAVLNQEKTYSESITIKAIEENQNDGLTQKIILFTALGVFVVLIIVLVVKKIINARKIQVR